ncbi:MAG: phosphatase PAP2 family protein [bacterium]
MSFKNTIRKNVFLYISSIASFILLVGIVYFFPVGFSSYRIRDTFAPLWFFITSTGAFYGGTAIIISVLIYLLVYFKRYKNNSSGAVLFVLIIFVVQIFMAGSTLFFFKDYFHNERPSQFFLTSRGYIDSSGVKFFALSMEEKRKYLHLRIQANKDSIEDVYPPILEGWIYDSGYSFPSGHSETAFFLGTIMAFILYTTQRNKIFSIIPFIWAILVCLSRVVIGIHFPIDVTAGAFVGLALGLTVISLNKINKIFE